MDIILSPIYPIIVENDSFEFKIPDTIPFPSHCDTTVPYHKRGNVMNMERKLSCFITDFVNPVFSISIIQYKKETLKYKIKGNLHNAAVAIHKQLMMSKMFVLFCIHLKKKAIPHKEQHKAKLSGRGFMV